MAPCRCLDGYESTKCLWRWELDRKSSFFFSPPTHLCALTYMTEISLIVTINKPIHLTFNKRKSSGMLGLKHKTFAFIFSSVAHAPYILFLELERAVVGCHIRHSVTYVSSPRSFHIRDKPEVLKTPIDGIGDWHRVTSSESRYTSVSEKKDYGHANIWRFLLVFMPPNRMIGGILFLSCLSVCLSVVNFNLRYNFWTVRDRDFIFGMHTPLMTPFQMTPRSMTLWLWPWS